VGSFPDVKKQFSFRFPFLISLLPLNAAPLCAKSFIIVALEDFRGFSGQGVLFFPLEMLFDLLGDDTPPSSFFLLHDLF